MHDFRQAIEHRLVDLQEGGIARSPIVHHDLFDASPRGQRPWRQQQRVPGFGFAARAAGDGVFDDIGGSSECENGTVIKSAAQTMAFAARPQIGVSISARHTFEQRNIS